MYLFLRQPIDWKYLHPFFYIINWWTFHIYICYIIEIMSIIFFFPLYSSILKPLDQPVDKIRGEVISQDILKRVNHLEQDAVAYLTSFNKMLSIKAKRIEVLSVDPSLIEVAFLRKRGDSIQKFPTSSW